MPDNGRLESAVVFSMMIDWDFLCSEVPALAKLEGRQLTILSGEGQLAGTLPLGASVHYPSLPDYGSHHSKGILAYYRGKGAHDDGSSDNPRDGDHLVFVVTTANFLHCDIRCKTNGVWAAVAPAKLSSSATPPSEFENDAWRFAHPLG